MKTNVANFIYSDAAFDDNTEKDNNAHNVIINFFIHTPFFVAAIFYLKINTTYKFIIYIK